MRRMSLVMTIAVLALSAIRADAQSVLGRLVDSTTRQGVAGALVTLERTDGTIAGHGISGAGGQFLLRAPGAGSYALGIAAIGYRRHAAIPVTVDTGVVTLPDALLAPIVVTLPEMIALGGKRECGKSGLDDASFGRILEGAEQSLDVMQQTIESDDVAFDVDLIHRRIANGNPPDTIADTTVSRLHNWPVQSIPPDSLRKVGFARPMTNKEGSGWIYYGPDVSVLFSDWFLAGHCFTVARSASSDSTLRIAFEPQHHTRNVDIRGELLLDRRTLALERLSFTHVFFPFGSLDGASGGRLTFLHVAEGVWLPVEWTLWAPVAVQSRPISRPMLGNGGRVGVAQPSLLAPVSASGGTLTVVGRVELHGQLAKVSVLGQ